MRRTYRPAWMSVLAILTLVVVRNPSFAQSGAQIDLEAVRGDRRVVLDWNPSPESADSLFAGYQVWRSISPDPGTFQLLRRFERRYPVSWTFRTPAPPNSRREFVDPDSIVAYRKVRVGADSAIVREYVGIPPFNGFPYHYAVTWMSECLTALNDTIAVDEPQPPITCIGQRCFFLRNGDTLLVNRVPCRRIDPRTNRPVGDTTFVYQGTVQSEELLRFHAIEATRLDSPVFPSPVAGPNLSRIGVVPNPYISSAPWDEPGQRKIQFVHLTERATVRIFTVGADLVRVLEHPAPGSPPDQGSLDWDLKNADGKFVESGIYIFEVETPGGVANTQGRLVIVR